MEIEENELENERSETPTLYISNWLMDLYAITYRLIALKCDGTASLIGLMT
jgi:hypothetical protein